MKKGNQKPAFELIGEYHSSLGKKVAKMFETDGGATFYPCQKRELELMLARKDDGSPAAMTIGISKPRQNGKSYAARFYAAYMADFEHRHVLYSAHHSKTTHQMFTALCNLFENKKRFPDFAMDVKNISRAKGFEGIYFNDWQDTSGEWHDGGCIEFSTRTNSGARGGTYSIVIIDEAQELTFDQQEALLPTLSAAASVEDRESQPQQIHVGTPPSPTCKGNVFRKMHDNAHSLKTSSLWWLEWGVQSQTATEQEINQSNYLELACMSNPAMGYRISEEVIKTEFEQMSLDGFARERLGWWSPVVTENIDYAINKDSWAACMSEEAKPEGKTAYGIKFSADGSSVALCGAVCPVGFEARISLIELRSTGSGIQWLADWLNERSKSASCVVIDGRNGVDFLIDKIKDIWRNKDSIIVPTSKNVIAAASQLVQEINEQTVTWFKYQQVLNESATTAIKRPFSGGWGFGGDNSTPIEAAALALWGCRTSKRDPTRKMRIG